MKDPHGFEDDLRRDLAMLADQSPAGPSAERVLAALKRRTAGRRWLAAGGIAAAAAVAVMAGTLALSTGPRVGEPVGLVAAAPAVGVERAEADAELVRPAADPVTTARGEDAAWSSFGARLSLATPVSAARPLFVESQADWDLSLNLRLALSEAGDEASPVLRLPAPTWR